MAEGEEDQWLFGFGSLIWKPDVPFLEQRAAFLPNYVRRFWQGVSRFGVRISGEIVRSSFFF